MNNQPSKNLKEGKDKVVQTPTEPTKNKQKKNETATSQEDEFDVSTEDLNENELRDSTENQPLRNAELENDRFNDQLDKK